MTRRCCPPLARRLLFVILPLLLLCSSPATAVQAQGFALQSDTLMRFFERDTSKGNDTLILPLYEYLRLDYAADARKQVQFHAYGWVRGDLNDSSYYDDATDGALLYGYLEYRPSFQNASLRVGRMPVFYGVATDTVDGIAYSSNLGKLLTVSAFAGQSVGYTETAGRSGDLALGGRLGYRYDQSATLGLSYLLKRNDSDTVMHRLAVDLDIPLPADLVFDAFTSLNLDGGGLGEQNYALRANLLQTDFKLFFETFTYNDYFSDSPSAPQPFRALATSGETVSRYGLQATRLLGSAWEAGARLTGYSYDNRSGSTWYAAALLTWRAEGRQQIGGEVGYLDAGIIDDNQLLLHLFLYWDQLPQAAVVDFVSGDIVYAAYDKGFFGETASFFSSLGAGKSFLDETLELKFSADYSSDPYFDSDLRGLLSLTYRYQN